MRHLAQYPYPDRSPGDVLVVDDLEQYEVEVDRLDPELRAWLAEEPALRRLLTPVVNGAGGLLLWR